MIALVVAVACAIVWERANLARWDSGEQISFWVLLALVTAWTVAWQFRLAVPTPTGLTQHLFNNLSRRYLTPKPDIYW